VRTTLNPTASSALPVDFPAVLAALQDQIDDLTAAVEAHHRQLVELSGTGSATAER